MTQENRETMQRALGIIDGVSLVAPKEMRFALGTAVEMLDAVMKSEGE